MLSEKALLQFSGGKDSTALLYLCRPWLSQITVLFADTGAVYPHVVDFVHETCEQLGAKLQIVRPPESVAAFTAREGLPADIVPVETLAEMQWTLPKPRSQLVQSYIRCCSAMIFTPMAKAVAESGITTVLRGSKKSDSRVGVADGYVEDGVTYLSPLWKWSDAQVYRYLEKEGVTLPKHYAAVPDSLDCWLCTGHLLRHGAAKLKWTKDNCPDLWPELSRRLGAVREAIDSERAVLGASFDLVG